MTLFKKILKTSLTVFAVSGSVALMGLPSGESVQYGQVGFNRAGSALNVEQTSARAVVDWANFSIAQGEVVHFQQLDAQSAILNRVTGGQLSQLDGSLNANGQVFLLNPNGIVVGATGRIETAGFLASTADYADADAFINSGSMSLIGANAPIVIKGKINAGNGDVLLLAKTITVDSGAEVKGKRVTLAGDSEYLIPLAEGIYAEASQSAGAYDGDILQSGTIEALDTLLLLGDDISLSGKSSAGNSLLVNVDELDGAGLLKAPKVAMKIKQTSKLGDIEATDLDVDIAGYLSQEAGTTLKVSGDADIQATRHVTLDNHNDFNVLYVAGRDVIITDINKVTIRGLKVEDDLVLTANEGIQSTGAIEVADEALIVARWKGVTLDHADNDFGGKVKIHAGNITITDKNAISLSGIIAHGDLVVKASGVVRDFDAFEIHGHTTILNEGYDVSLDNADNQFYKSVSVTGLQVRIADRDDLELKTFNVADDLYVTAKGVVSNSGKMNIADITDVKTEGAIKLNNAGNDFQGALYLDGGYVFVTDINGLDIGSITSSSNLIIKAAGRIRDLGALNISGTTRIYNAGFDTILDHAENDFYRILAESVDLTIVDKNGFSLGELTVTDDLVLTSGGSIRSYDKTYVGDTAIITTEKDITFKNSENDFKGLLTLKGEDINIEDANELDLNGVQATGRLDVVTKGLIRDFDPIVVAGYASFKSDHDIKLNNPDNDFSTLSADGLEIKITDKNGLRLARFKATDDLYLYAGGDVYSTSQISIADQLHIKAAGDISLLSRVNDFYRFEANANNIYIRDVNDLVLNDIQADNLTVISRGEDTITDSVFVSGEMNVQ